MTSPTVTLRAPAGAGPPLPDHAELLLEEFFQARRIGAATRRTYRSALQSWTRRVPTPLEEADATALATWYARLSSEGYGPGTIFLYAMKLRALCAWTLRRRGLKKRAAATEAGDLFEEIPFEDLRRQAARGNELRDKLVTGDEYEFLMAATDHPRLRALLATLYESGARPGEMLGLRLRDLEFQDRYAQIRVSGKTGERTIPLVRAIPYLRAWLQVHPARGEPDAPLFARVFGGQVGPLTIDGLEGIFRRLRSRAGLKRRIHAYMFRHTRLTELADRGLGEYKMKVLAGWTPDSRMAARYIHLSGRSSLAPILKMEGVEVPEDAQPKPSPIKVRTCPRCDSENEGDALYCMRCGLALDAATAIADQAQDREEDIALIHLLDDPRVQEVVMKALKDLIAGGVLPGQPPPS